LEEEKEKVEKKKTPKLKKTLAVAKVEEKKALKISYTIVKPKIGKRVTRSSKGKGASSEKVTSKARPKNLKSKGIKKQRVKKFVVKKG